MASLRNLFGRTSYFGSSRRGEAVLKHAPRRVMEFITRDRQNDLDDGGTFLPGSTINLKDADVENNSAVRSAILNVQMVLNGCQPGLWRGDTAGHGGEFDWDHEASDLLAYPTGARGQGWLRLFQAVISDLMIYRQSYIRIIRGSLGQPIALWFIPAHEIEVEWDSRRADQYIHHYAYSIDDQQEVQVRPDDMIDIGIDVDRKNVRLGRPVLGALKREVMADQQANLLQTAVLKNLGLALVVMSPGFDGGHFSDSQTSRLKQRWNESTQGDAFGGIAVMSDPVKIETISVNLADLQLPEIRIGQEFRIYNALGVPPRAGGARAGAEGERAGSAQNASLQLIEGLVIPLLDIIAGCLTDQLLKPNWDVAKDERIRFDTSVLAPRIAEIKSMHEDVRLMWESNLISRGQAQDMLGVEIDSDGADKYISDFAVQPTGAKPAARQGDQKESSNKDSGTGAS